MTLSEDRINNLIEKGFTRWTKGNYDRLYINATALGLDCTYYKTGNISGATFGDYSISNSEARRMKAAKTYVDIKTGKVHSDNYTLLKAVEKLLGIEE